MSAYLPDPDSIAYAQLLQNMQDLNNKFSIFINGNADQFVPTANGQVMTLAGVEKSCLQNRYVQKIVDVQSLAYLESNVTNYQPGTLFRIWGDPLPTNNGIFTLNTNNTISKVSYADLYDLKEFLPNPWDYDTLKFDETMTNTSYLLATVSQPLQSIGFNIDNFEMDLSYKIDMNSQYKGYYVFKDINVCLAGVDSTNVFADISSENIRAASSGYIASPGDRFEYVEAGAHILNFIMKFTPSSKANTDLRINGISTNYASYTITGNVLTLVGIVLSLNDRIELVNLGVTGNRFQYTDTGTHATTITLPFTPTSQQSIDVRLNGKPQPLSTWSLATNVVTLIGFTTITNDIIDVIYYGSNATGLVADYPGQRFTYVEAGLHAWNIVLPYAVTQKSSIDVRVNEIVQSVNLWDVQAGNLVLTALTLNVGDVLDVVFFGLPNSITNGIAGQAYSYTESGTYLTIHPLPFPADTNTDVIVFVNGTERATSSYQIQNGNLILPTALVLTNYMEVRLLNVGQKYGSSINVSVAPFVSRFTSALTFNAEPSILVQYQLNADVHTFNIYLVPPKDNNGLIIAGNGEVNFKGINKKRIQVNHP